MTKMNTVVVFAISVALCCAREMLINDIQVKGSSHSYHVIPRLSVPFFNFSHPTISSQLSFQGVFAVEIDFEFVGGEFAVFKTRNVDDVSNCPNVTFCLRSVHNFSTSGSGRFPLFIIISSSNQNPLSKWVWDVSPFLTFFVRIPHH